MQLRRWVAVIVCCNTNLLKTIEPLSTTLQEKYDALRNEIPSPQTLLPGTEISLLQLQSARNAAASAVRDLLSKLVESKSGGSYRPPLSSTVDIVNPRDSLMTAVPSVYVDTTALPDRPGLPPDGGVNWEDFMEDAIFSWSNNN